MADVAALPCRPTVACTAEIATAGTTEIEAGLFASKSEATRAWTYPFLLKHTFASWLQLQATSNGLTTIRGATRARFFDNVAVGPKLHLVDQSALLPSFALTALASIPTFAASGYTRAYDVVVTGHASKDVGRLHLDYNAGANLLALDQSPTAQAFTALALSTAIVAPLGAALEGWFASDASPAAPHDGGVRAAFAMTPRPWIVLDFGADVGFFPSTRAYSLFAGMSIAR
jgi:hypothetical protein